MPSSRFNAGAMSTEDGWGTELLCDRGCVEIAKEKSLCIENMLLVRYMFALRNILAYEVPGKTQLGDVSRNVRVQEA